MEVQSHWQMDNILLFKERTIGQIGGFKVVFQPFVALNLQLLCSYLTQTHTHSTHTIPGQITDDTEASSTEDQGKQES